LLTAASALGLSASLASKTMGWHQQYQQEQAVTNNKSIT
jgi:hypothetical protein